MQYPFTNQNKSVMTPFEFDLPTDQNSIIKVIGVGGGGSNAVNHMFEQGIEGVNFVVCNTDAQALHASPVPNKIQLGPTLTQGLGAGANPEVGMQACEESIEEIRTLLGKNTKMVFITAGMGGGTGTGAAPVVARVAREMGILTVGIVTTPFSFEGRKRHSHAIEGINKLREQVDTILVIGNDKIRMMYGNLTQSQAFSHANNILTTAAKSISEIITKPGIINVDFADVRTVMFNGGSAIMGNAFAEGNDRANIAIQTALNSPLLNDNDIRGAKNVLVNIASGEEEVRIDEIESINDYIQAAAHETDIILGTSRDMSLGNKLMVTVIATGFEAKLNESYAPVQKLKVYDLDKHAVIPTTPVAEEKQTTTITNEPIVENGKVIYSLEEETITSTQENAVDVSENINNNHSPLTENIAENTGNEEENYSVTKLTLEEENEFDLFSGLENKMEENSIELELTPTPQTVQENLLNETDESNISENEPFYVTSNEELETGETGNNFQEEEEPFTIYKRSLNNENTGVKTSDNSFDVRKQKLMQLSMKNYKKNPSEFEKPAIQRNETLTNNNNHLSKSSLSLSSYSVSDSGNEYSNPEIKKDNKFINDRPC
jgi:cell division protein FtsZ